MISLWSTKVPKSNDMCPVGGRATQTQGTGPCADTGRDCTAAGTSQGKPRSVESLETRGEAWTRPSLRASTGTQPC